MASETEVVWKCGNCEECFYDLQILAGHKCIGNTVLSESAIKQLQVHSLDMNDYSNDDMNGVIEAAQVSDLPYANASYTKPNVNPPPVRKKHTPSHTNRKQPPLHKQGKRSIVWTYFTALDEKRAMCCVCQKILRYCGTPTNLVYHLGRYHPNESAVVRSKQGSGFKYQYLTRKIRNMTGKPVQKRRNFMEKSDSDNGPHGPMQPSINVVQVPNAMTVLTKKADVTAKITEMLIKDMLPISTVEGQGFGKLISALDPYYKLPTAKEFFVDHIPKRYYDEYKTVQALVKDAEKVHTSVELWGGYGNKSFVTVVVHFSTKDFVCKQLTLNTYCLDSLDPDHIMTNVVTSISHWDLSLDVHCIVHDGSDLMTKVAQLTGWNDIPCFAHTLDNIVKTSIASSSEVVGVVAKCRDLVHFLRNNESAKQQLLEAQMRDKNLKLQHSTDDTVDVNAATDKKFPLQLKKDNAAEWISTFYMLQRISTLKNIITEIGNSNSSFDALTRKEWMAVEEIISILKAFEVVIQELCSEPYQYVSKVIPVALGLNGLINNCTSISLPFVEKVRMDILSALRSRFGDVEHNLTLAMATILDPRLKNIAFQSEAAMEAAIRELTSEASKLVRPEDTQEAHERDADRDNMSITDSLWAGFERKATPKKQVTKNNDVVSTEIKKYLDEMLLDRKKDPFVWWKNQGSAKYPVLSRLAKNILCIPATSTPPERVLLKKGRQFNERRKLIKPKHIDQFLFLNMNVE